MVTATPSFFNLHAALLSNNDTPVVIDNGTECCKIGMAGDDAPQAVFPCVVGSPKYMYRTALAARGLRGNYIGVEAQQRQESLLLKYPVEHGHITDWDEMERIWRHCFYEELYTMPDDHSILLTESPLNSRNNREKMTEIMFETFSTPALYIACNSVLSVYTSGSTTGVVLDAGYGLSHAVPVYDGYALRDSIVRSSDVCGRVLTESLMTMLNDRDYSLNYRLHKGIVQDIKENLCYVAQDFDHETRTAFRPSLKKSYDLPDGRVIVMKNERFRCPEAMFRPTMLQRSRNHFMGIHEAVYTSIKQCCKEIRKDMYANIVLSGGSTMFPGMVERLEKELSSLAPASAKINIIAPPNRRLSAWIGGSVFASLPNFENMCMSKAEYQEVGHTIVHRKCF